VKNRMIDGGERKDDEGFGEGEVEYRLHGLRTLDERIDSMV
jgi:hypothetical protein